MAPTSSHQVTFIGVQRPGEVIEDPYVCRRGSHAAAAGSSQQCDVSQKSKNRCNHGVFHPQQQQQYKLQQHQLVPGARAASVAMWHCLRSVSRMAEADTWLKYI